MITNRVQLFQAMQEKALVITPNNRLSQELMNEFFKFSQEPVQAKPSCLAYSTFLQSSYKKLCYYSPDINHPLVLSSQQCRFLWRKILSKSKKMVNEGLVQALEDAWTRCHLWQVDFNDASFSHNIPTQEFQSWALELEKLLITMNALSEEHLVTYILSQPNQYPYQKLIWACFDDFSPQQLALQAYFSAHGCQNVRYDLHESKNLPLSMRAKDSCDEYQQVLYWIQECLAKNQQRIAVVVPELKTEAPRLKRFLQQNLNASFNISLGLALADYPLVADALCFLELDTEQLSLAQAQLLLNSPYLAGSQAEMLARAQFREDSKILQELYFAKSSLSKELKNTVPKLAELLHELSEYPQSASPQAWLNHFRKRLKRLGFPGEYPLNSASYQCYQRFLVLFDEFRQFAVLTSEMTSDEALSLLKNLAKATIFQPKNDPASVQILGLLEVAGSTFDSLWVTGLTDLCLPQKTRFSAFIPISLQREKQMPYACPSRELQLAEKALKRLTASANQVIFSYPQLTEDKPNLPSPLIRGLACFSPYSMIKKTTQLPLINFIDTYAIPFSKDELASGGTAILANQAKCPFRAFATHRLHAKAALKVSDGPDAIERGKIIHKVMELLWKALKNQKTLLHLDEAQLNKEIEQAIHQALEPLIKQRGYSFSSLIQEVEFAKLKKLVHACLDWERQRPAFEVEALEEAFHINLSGTSFSLRVDRLDKLEDGSKWVIDYKSSLPSSLPWKEERPKEPQLLLYALLDESINGLLFAQLKAGQLQCKGLTAENHSMPGLSTLKKDESWLDYRQAWQQQLTELAEEFSQGHCAPKPLNSAVCQLCDLHNLCRFEW
ncbi:MAG: PD-(D/E)XK nuclease family protein [Tatlockia sp.]|nr:PD-(D/E)XK nuclease family protein [Tatlockia sp.]